MGVLKIKNDLGEWESLPTIKGEGVAKGGNTNQVLNKKSTNDFDTAWTELKTINGISLLGQGNISTAAVGLVPTGAVLQWTTNAAPTDWLICDGAAVSRTTYAALFGVVGTTYGVGNGSTTFNLPNLKTRVPVGRDVNDASFDTLGETGGAKTHTLTTSELPNRSFVSGDHAVMAAEGSSGHYAYDYEYNISGGGQAHNNLQPYIVLNYIIKT